jgi:hypothetical protein
LYIDDKFYTDISSNALFDNNGDIYYFKQNNKKRTLYKNREKLFTLNSYYAKIVDTNNDNVYFISNSKNGASVYKYNLNNKTIYKISSYDNIVQAKTISNNRLLVVGVNENSYNINIIEQKNSKPDIYQDDLEPYQTKFRFQNNTNNQYLKSNRYNEFKELKFSSLYPSYGYGSYEGAILNLNSYFTDPLNFNSIYLTTYFSNVQNYANIAYSHSRNIVKSYLGYYYLKQRYIDDEIYTNEIINVNLGIDILKQQRDTIKANLSYYVNSNLKEKRPIIFDINYHYSQSFSNGDLVYLLSDLTIMLKKDREDSIYGFEYKFNKHIYNELYFNFQTKYLNSDIKNILNNRGIKIINNKFLNPIDKTDTYIEGMDYNFYIKKLSKLSLGVSKSFSYPIYFYKFPLSIHKETLFYQKNQFDIVQISKHHIVKENIIGTKFDLLFAHNINLPLSIKYIENNYAVDDYKVNISLGMQF